MPDIKISPKYGLNPSAQHTIQTVPSSQTMMSKPLITLFLTMYPAKNVANTWK